MSEDVYRALYLMELSFPLTPEDIRRRYRELAKQWHPDLNPDDSKAHEKMSELNAAAEALTGIEASSIPQYTGATFTREIDRREFTVEGITFTTNISMRISGSYACDWIYAASFAANSDAAYLAGYSGRVILVDEHGEGVRVYDIGSIPRRIVDTGDYLYLLTDTRLYVLRDEALHSIVDTYDSGDLVVAQTGFGLLEKKRLRWFSADGQYLGSVIATDPIRRAYWDGDAMVVETRRRRAIVQGAPAWWK
ncbi:MAG: J domain-containing protein [Firmicutes bacterium]|nr:J domain-containing protein [Bacillota bacterium]